VSFEGLRYERVRAKGEWMMRVGPSDAAATILFVPPLFEELNRTRALIAGIMRRLAASGYGCALPDLPGTGESALPLESLCWAEWHAAIADISQGFTATAAIRGGCLLDDSAAPGLAWRFAPAEGASLVRDLERAGLVSGGGSAGYDPGAELIEPLREAGSATGKAVRVVRLASDRGEADLKVEGPPLWRRAEPQNSYELIDALASDIEQWLRQCAAS
jgi:pimeloyl-ACP methyl ester carboxylesterase